MKRQIMMGAALALCLVATAAEKNLFVNDGYFAPGDSVPFSSNDASGKCRAGVVPSAYEKGTALLVVSNLSAGCVRFTTKKTYPVCDDLMVFEVMARAVGCGGGAQFVVIGITPRYKHIAHKHYRLTKDWRKYVAILAVPPDAEKPDRSWRGLIDVPSGVNVEIGRLSLYPAKNDESIAGMALSIDEEDAETLRKGRGPNLADFDGPVPTSTAFVSSQAGNKNPITALPTRRSDEIASDSALGAALHNEINVKCPATGCYYPWWSTCWAIADDDLRKNATRATFSTHRLALSSTNVDLTVRLAAPVALEKLRITTRENTLAGFPYDWHVDVSADGKTFRTVKTVKDYNEEGVRPEIPLDGSPVLAFRIVADRIRPESKTCGYLQLDKVEALDAAGVNHALLSKGASADTSDRMCVPVISRKSYYDDTIIDCGVKSVLMGINIVGGDYDNALQNGFAIGSPRFETLTDNVRYLKSRGVKTYMRISWERAIFNLRTEEDLAKFKADYIAKITPFVKAWKGMVAGYPLGGEENQYLVLKSQKSKLDIPFFKRAYREAVIAASDAIHAIDPDAKTSVTTALFDFGWTEEHLKNGLAKALDEVAVDTYHEQNPLGSYPEKCESFFVDGRRGFESERLYTRAEDELKGFRALLDKYNPKLGFAVHEMSQRIGPYPKGINSTEEGQAKSALRMYIMHQYYNITPSCWWGFHCCRETQQRPDDFYEWGVIAAGVKRPAWYAMQRFAALFDNSWKPMAEMPLKFSPEDERYYSYLFGRGKERLATCWTAVSMRDQNTGKLADVFVPGDFGGEVPEVECIDLLSGGVQRLNVEKAPGGFKVRNLVMRDYPLVFRYAVR